MIWSTQELLIIWFPFSVWLLGWIGIAIYLWKKSKK